MPDAIAEGTFEITLRRKLKLDAFREGVHFSILEWQFDYPVRRFPLSVRYSPFPEV